MGKVFRIYVEKKDGFAVEAHSILQDLRKNLGITELKSIRFLNRYDVEGISEEDFKMAKHTIFSEPPVDKTYDTLPESGISFAVEYLPGQFDQRADSCAQCISLLNGKERPLVRSAKVFLLEGDISAERLSKIKAYLINPVESREASLDTVETLAHVFETPETVETLTGFINLSKEELDGFVKDLGLAMDLDDILFCQSYFKNTEKRDPTITEIRMIDTYWSDHCRHTTFLTHIEAVTIEPTYIKAAYEKYHSLRQELYSDKIKPQTLMDIAVIGAKYLKKQGLLHSLDESEEINACSVRVTITVDGKPEDWLLMFKNETHNHPTEIEPFGGAATCLGGAIRDPLSGRAYVYQAMRVTGAADPRRPVEETIPGKLPQKKITLGAAQGYSSYGNQIGLATGLVKELYHDGYLAKRMEIGAVIGAAPAENVVRLVPSPGDIVILLGGRTGRDGCGGATGSSKSHTVESISSCGAEVQKGNPPEERKIQRLFRNKTATTLIKRCNDFGAGGVSVAIGELADGLVINLNAVPKKYEGLSGTEIAISESQERMAVVVSPEHVDQFISLAKSENLEATVVATVTEEPRLRMEFYGKQIVDLSREFLNSNGAEKKTDAVVSDRRIDDLFSTGVTGSTEEKWKKTLADLNVCSQKGLVERFDSTIGAGSVLMPYGGKKQLSETQLMAAKFPVLHGKTDDCSLMSYGFDPYLSAKSPFHGAVFAVTEAVSKLVASGASLSSMWLTLQEYFPRTKNDPKRWGLPFEALLGALTAQLELGIGAIGGKDSMSGSFEAIDVPPTLTAFAVSIGQAGKIVTNEFKTAGSKVYLVKAPLTADNLPDFTALKALYEKIAVYISDDKIRSSFALTRGGIAEAITKMALGNGYGFLFDAAFDESILFDSLYGSILLETDEALPFPLVGQTTSDGIITLKSGKITLDTAEKIWSEQLETVFPTKADTAPEQVAAASYSAKEYKSPAIKAAKPTVVIPVFPGTNCEYDSARAFEKAGANAEIVIIRNLTGSAVDESVLAMKNAIDKAQMILFPGGFSGGDEPDGSGKFIATFFRNSFIKESVTTLLEQRDGLILGICNGFQALIKLGLVPFGKITDIEENFPTLTFNEIGRHQSMLVRTRVASTLSPWFSGVSTGDIHTIPISHGEGRFIAEDALVKSLSESGQIATQYVDLSGNPTMDIRFNPNASVFAIEGITSKDGRVLGKMGHSERTGENLYRNVPGDFDQKLFQSGVNYFK